ncbi:hypothetical protein KSP40_PGU020630 [Platanthera guangdongensis]|uniref:Uncharacterized protein n=1 Tax=Platanthera guangdongensis TaxID=2320717 RepID=A0ABR2LBG4_9ASPA
MRRLTGLSRGEFRQKVEQKEIPGQGWRWGLLALCISIVGDVGTGNTSLILATIAKYFSENVRRVFPHILLDEDYFLDPVPLGIINTSSTDLRT